MKVIVQGRGEVTLDQRDFVGAGGFGDVYAKGDTAYKIYQDPSKVIPVGKIRELAVITDPDIIRPWEPILSKKNRMVGYTMRYLPKTYTLCQLFPRAFRDRNSLDPEKCLKLVLQLRSQVAHCHDKGIVVVDLNEMNELVSPDFSKIYTIDVDNFRTRSYPSLGLMESVRDHHARDYGPGSDWFSFAVVTFQLFVGIHPYKGKHPRFGSNLVERMQNNISVFNGEVSYPRGSVLPFDVIPHEYLRWYEAVFERGLREAPPEDPRGRVVVVHKVAPVVGSGQFQVVTILELPEKILSYYNATNQSVSVTSGGIYLGKKKTIDCPPDTLVVSTPDHSRPVATWVENDKVVMVDLTTNQNISVDYSFSKLTVCDNRIVGISGDHFVEVKLFKLSSKVVPTFQVVGDCIERSTTMFDGVAIQNLMKRWLADLFPLPGTHHSIPLPELDGWQVTDAKYRNHVLQVVAVHRVGAEWHRKERWSRWVYRFSLDFSQRDVFEVPDITPSGLNFVSKDNGTVVQIDEQGRIQLFSNRPMSTNSKTIHDPEIGPDLRLESDGPNVIFIHDNRVCSISMK